MATKPNRRTASAQIRGDIIEVVVPKRWPRDFRESVAQKLVKRVQKQFTKDYILLQSYSGPTVTFDHVKDLEPWITQINQQTLQVPLKGVRIGWSKYSRLAQMNLRTHMMTVSKYCLNNAPEAALRYLIIHELAHLRVADHSKAFWREVDQFVEDRPLQCRLIQATHRIRLYESELEARLKKQEKAAIQPVAEPLVQEPIEKPGLFQQLLLTFFD